MSTFHFKKWNTLLGWTIFLIAFSVYFITVEPTVSFWDCGEYISTSAKLQVGHPPGAPLFQMVGAFMAIFATDASKVAFMVNMVSVISSAFTILFLFWTSTHVLSKIISPIQGSWQQKAILAASSIGALTYTFSDSFWYSAVEAEVYAMASMFIAIMFWLGLKWEESFDKPGGNKWLLLICLMIGLSFGVHFMALLTIPSIGLLYYFKKYKNITTKSFIVANIVVIAILLFIFKLLLPWTMSIFGHTEVFMVNSLGLPFNSGTIFSAIVLISIFFFGIRYTTKKQLTQANLLLLCIMYIFIGFSTWLMLPVRANADVVINENKPSDARELLAYYNREQYPSNPLFYGPLYTDMFAGQDPVEPFLDKKPNYERDYSTGKYVITNHYKNATPNSHRDHKSILPRMWSTDHAANYMSFTTRPEFEVHPDYNHERELHEIVKEFKQGYELGEFDNEDVINFLSSYGEYLNIQRPTLFDNLSYMFNYQFGYMYWRYLMWNFSGRQNDIQGQYDNFNGNWITGIKFIDEIRLGTQNNLPSDVLNNKGRNIYFGIPFILGIIGLVWMFRKDIKWFYVLLVLFLFTGIALKVYLNERPFEPRERDYALVGSFYVFAIWVGLGVYAIIEFLSSKTKPTLAIISATALSFAGAPLLMASQNWDDHDRSDKYTALSSARAYLESCDPNTILFTIGDNDTFPLWYAQEIEGIRRDVRVVNTQLLMTDWHIDQMKMKAYESEPLPISFDRKLYVGDKLDYALYIPKTENRWNLNDFMKFIKSEDPNTYYELRPGQNFHFYPTNKIRIPVDKDAVIKNKVVSEKYYDSIVPYMDMDIKSNGLYKARTIMLDIINNNNWERPIAFSGGSMSDEEYLWLKDYLQLQGMVYKLVPVKTAMNKERSPLDLGDIDTDKMYGIMKNLYWGNMGSPDIYHDPETRKNSISYRSNIARLTEKLIQEGKLEKAKEMIELNFEHMPIEYYGYYTLVQPYAEFYYQLDEIEKARETLKTLIKKYQENIIFFDGMTFQEKRSEFAEIYKTIERYRMLIEVAKHYDDMEFFQKESSEFNKVIVNFVELGIKKQ